MSMEQVQIHSEYIRLDAFLKFAGEAGTGGEAKISITGGNVRVNGEICTQRGKKIRPGDTVETGGRAYAVTGI